MYLTALLYALTGLLLGAFGYAAASGGEAVATQSAGAVEGSSKKLNDSFAGCSSPRTVGAGTKSGSMRVIGSVRTTVRTPDRRE